jgi:hypothetical protein
MGHAAGRIGRGDVGKRGRRLVPGKRMVKRHGAVEILLHRGTALDLELHRAQPRQIVRVVLCEGDGECVWWSPVREASSADI